MEEIVIAQFWYVGLNYNLSKHTLFCYILHANQKLHANFDFILIKTYQCRANFSIYFYAYNIGEIGDPKFW